MNLKDICTRNVIRAEPGETLATVAHRMQENNVGTIVIVENQRLVGIVTDRDLALALGARGARPQTEVREVMTHDVLTIPADRSIYSATKFMKDHGVRRLPIVDRDNHLVGIITLDDLLRFLGRELYNLAEGIRHEMK